MSEGLKMWDEERASLEQLQGYVQELQSKFDSLTEETLLTIKQGRDLVVGDIYVDRRTLSHDLIAEIMNTQTFFKEIRTLCLKSGNEVIVQMDENVLVGITVNVFRP